MLRAAYPLCLLLSWGCSGGDGSAGPPAAGDGPAAPPPAPAPGFADQMTAGVNELRAQARDCGGRTFPATLPVTWDERLATAAAVHATDMATHNFFSHTGSDGLDVSHRVTLQGYPWSRLGENIAAGTGTLQATLDLWLASPGHCANLMSPLFSQIGAARVEAPATADFPVYWTLVLADPF